MFDILDFESANLISTFNNVSLPALASDLEWDQTNLYTTGELLVSLSQLLSDFNHDGLWNLPDLNLVLFNWQQNEASLPTEWVNQRPAIVGLESLNLVLFNWQQASNSLAAVPEPVSASMLVVAAVFGITMIRRERRGSR